MSTLLNLTDKDPTYGYEAVGRRQGKPEPEYLTKARDAQEKAWKASQDYAEQPRDENWSYKTFTDLVMASIAAQREYQGAWRFWNSHYWGDCTCTPTSDACPACKQMIRLTVGEEIP